MSEAEFVKAIKTNHPDLIVSAEVLRSKRVSAVVKREGFLEVAKTLKDRVHEVDRDGTEHFVMRAVKVFADGGQRLARPAKCKATVYGPGDVFLIEHGCGE